MIQIVKTPKHLGYLARKTGVLDRHRRAWPAKAIRLPVNGWVLNV
jgi:hypothetical protein